MKSELPYPTVAAVGANELHQKGIKKCRRKTRGSTLPLYRNSTFRNISQKVENFLPPMFTCVCNGKMTLSLKIMSIFQDLLYTILRLQEELLKAP